jgi:tetratricopeptide (TPR) repeat protein
MYNRLTNGIYLPNEVIIKQNKFLNGMSMKAYAVLPLLVLLACASGGTKTASIAPVAAPVAVAKKPMQGISLDEAIEQSAREFQQKTATPRRVAIVQFDTEAEALSEYIMEEITGALVDFDFEVAERRNLDFVRNELDLQYSGEVDDESMVEIGRFIGAESILVGSLQKVGNTYRYRLSSIGVENAVREAAIRLDVRNDRAFNAILESLRFSKPVAPKPVFSKPVVEPKTAGAFLDSGIMFATRGDFALAIEDFSEAVKLKPDFASAYILRARALLASVSNVTDIKEDFSAFGSHTTKGVNNYTAANKPVYDKALADANTAIKLDSTSFKAYGLRASLYKDMENYDRAIADYNQALKLNPDASSSTYVARGLAYANKGDYDRAIADYNQAIRLDPDKASAYNNRGTEYYDKGDYDRAIADYTQAIRLDPDNAITYNNRGNAYKNKGDYDRAITDYTQAIRIDPDDAEAYNNRGIAYSNKSDYYRAIADFNQAIRLDPDKASAYFNRGLTYRYKGDSVRAIADYTQAIRLDPDYAAAYNNRGLAYNDKKDYEKAIADFNQAIRLDPDFASAYNNRGSAYGGKKDYDRAIADYNQAIRINPDYASAYNGRGSAYWMKGDKNRARADWRKALELDPNNESARKNLALP